METAILAMIVIVGLAGTILSVVLFRMIWTKDYSLVLGRRQQGDQQVVIPTSTLPISNLSLDLAVAHFVKETAEWANDAERTEQEQELLELRMRHQLK